MNDDDFQLLKEIRDELGRTSVLDCKCGHCRQAILICQRITEAMVATGRELPAAGQSELGSRSAPQPSCEVAQEKPQALP